MLSGVNAQYRNKLANTKNNAFIVESVLDVDEVMPGSDEELDDLIDVESIPPEVYEKVDQALDKLIGDDGIDDDEIEELIDDDDDLDDEAFEELDAVINEASNAWYDDEGIGHPDLNRRSGTKGQPRFAGSAMVH